MIVDDGIGGLELDRLFEFLRRLRVMAELEVRPAEAVDDVAVGRPEVDRAPQHLERLVEIDALVDPGIAEIIEHQRLIGKEFQRLLEIRLGLRPLLGALEADAAEIEQRPIAAVGRADELDRLVVGVRRVLELLGRALQAAERAPGVGVLGMGGDDARSGASSPRRSGRSRRIPSPPGSRRFRASENSSARPHRRGSRLRPASCRRADWRPSPPRDRDRGAGSARAGDRSARPVRRPAASCRRRRAHRASRPRRRARCAPPAAAACRRRDRRAPP